MKRLSAAFLAVALLASIAFAHSFEVTLFNEAAAVSSSGPMDVSVWPLKSYQVAIQGTATVKIQVSDHDGEPSVSIRNATYRWLASSSGTSNYYLDLVAGGDPGLDQPLSVLGNNAAFTQGTPGSLTASQWGYGDADTLGSPRIYVRLADSADPDSKAVGFVLAEYFTDLASRTSSGVVVSDDPVKWARARITACTSCIVSVKANLQDHYK